MIVLNSLIWTSVSVAGYKNVEKIRIATRQSTLALWQANYIKTLLESKWTGLQCEIIGMTTIGDRNKTAPLSDMGGKGVFVKELETALLEGNADIAVHSMKDVPGELPEGLRIMSIVERASPRDAFVSNNFASISDLPNGAKVGSSSLRRIRQLQHCRPELEFVDLRGNVGTRLRKLDEGGYDGVILAVAGLTRLGLSDRISEEISPDICLPAAGQGAIGIESRLNDDLATNLLGAINHALTHICVSAERQVTRLLGATCQLPVAVHADSNGRGFRLRAFVSNLSGDVVIKEEVIGELEDSGTLAVELGDYLLEQGAANLIAEQ